MTTEERKMLTVNQEAKISQFKTDKENYEELLADARKMTTRNIRLALNQRAAFHGWAVRAYEKALDEKMERLVQKATANKQ
jgi:hypothetical protein